MIDEDVKTAGRPIVLLEGGQSFSSDYCGDWVEVDPASLFQRTDAPETIPPGVWLAGEDFAPGRYEANPDIGASKWSPYCSWGTVEPWYSHSISDKDADFSDEEGPRTVTLTSGQLFSSDGCGDWTRQGP